MRAAGGNGEGDGDAVFGGDASPSDDGADGPVVWGYDAGAGGFAVIVGGFGGGGGVGGETGGGGVGDTQIMFINTIEYVRVVPIPNLTSQSGYIIVETSLFGKCRDA